MPSVAETQKAGSALEAALAAGLKQIAREQALTFTKYQRVVLPVDGYLFWLNTGITFSTVGSLHYGVDLRQAEDETIAVNRVLFTSEAEVQEFNAIAPDVLWIGQLGDQAASEATQAPGLDQFEPSPVLFAFSSRDLYFRKANLFHYAGVAVQPALLAQLVDDRSALPSEPIVGDSLPIWLSLTQYGPVYPSFLVPQNAVPPYIVAHIPPESTEALQAFPSFTVEAGPWTNIVLGEVNGAAVNALAVNASMDPAGGASSQTYELLSDQLLRDRVRLTLYGFTNQRAIQYLNYLFDYSLNTDAFGVMNMPVLRDEKRAQAEITAIAMKKSVEIDASYYQATAAAIARRLILSAQLAVTIGAG